MPQWLEQGLLNFIQQNNFFGVRGPPPQWPSRRTTIYTAKQKLELAIQMKRVVITIVR